MIKDCDDEDRGKSLFVYERSGEYSGMRRMLRKTGLQFYVPIVKLSRARNGALKTEE